MKLFKYPIIKVPDPPFQTLQQKYCCKFYLLVENVIVTAELEENIFKIEKKD